MFSQFLIYINVPVLICLDPNGNNVCSKFVYRESNSKKVKEFSSECCPDFYKKNDTCQLCPAGTYGFDCEHTCNPDYYGIQCKEECNCLKGYMCNSVNGCVRKESSSTVTVTKWNEFNNINRTDTGYRILKPVHITWVPHIESRSVFIPVVPVLVMCATIIGWLMICVQTMKSKCCEKKLNVTKKVEFNTQQHITKKGNNPYCEPWEVTSIV